MKLTVLLLAFGLAAYAQAPVLITQVIDESKLVTLAGNTRAEATAENDRGRVDDNMPLEHMLLQLNRSPQQEQALVALIDQLHDTKSAIYHQWLTSAQFGQRFGLAAQDLSTIRGWLESRGFTINSTYRSGMLIDFAGTAGLVRAAFHTEIHNLLVDGSLHFANMTDPRIPEALAPAVSGIVSLHNFRPRSMVIPRSDYTAVYGGSTYYNVSPTDLAVIYQLTPLFKDKHPKTGKGQTLAVIEDSDLYSASDFTNFRATFGLDRFKGGKLTTIHPPSSGTNNCIDPLVTPNSNEATIDAEYASAAAPDASIEVAACADTSTDFGGFLAIQNLVNATPPSIISLSYGACEANWGATGNAAFNTMYQQGVAEGVSIFVSTGDAGAAGCDQNQEYAVHGIAVNAFASTPYNVAVGGTDFGDSYSGTVSTYWKATNNNFQESAISYVPEIPWNDTCGSVLIAGSQGYTATYGSTGFCNSPPGANYLNTIAGGGGPSACATGVPAKPGIVGGTCAGYPKPSWQTGVAGIPSDGVRDLPDISMFAANGVWGHFYPVCYSDANNGGVPCTGAPNSWPGFGGTSFGAPILAGIQAIVNQVYGPQGNPNVVYYQIAAAEYGTAGNPACGASLGNKVSRTCTFHDVTLGDMDVVCKGKNNCYQPSGRFGVLSTDSNSYLPSFGAGTGWDFATGIGSLNAARLVKNWKTKQ